MNTQNLIKHKLAHPECITVIRQILETYDNLSRSAIAERVCERLELLDAQGIRVGSCNHASIESARYAEAAWGVSLHTS
jgi:hypothetical protein